jgi:hypothetical protein
MQNLVGSAMRRKAGFAAAVALAGGMAGTVLLAPGTAFASPGPLVTTTTSITGTHQWNYSSGQSTVRINVSVTAKGGHAAPAGSVAVTTGPAPSDPSCTVALDQGPHLTSTGYCYIKNLNDGPYKLAAAYTGQNELASSASAQDPVLVGGSWYRQPHVSTQLYCPHALVSGQSGWCTLVIRDSSWNAAYGVTAQIYLPSQLRAENCSRWCWQRGGTVSWRVGTVYPWQAKAVSVRVTALSTGLPWWHRSVRVTVGGAAFWNHPWWVRGASFTSTHVTVFRRW